LFISFEVFCFLDETVKDLPGLYRSLAAVEEIKIDLPNPVVISVDFVHMRPVAEIVIDELIVGIA
jgi:hypothetical protein